MLGVAVAPRGARLALGGVVQALLVAVRAPHTRAPVVPGARRTVIAGRTDGEAARLDAVEASGTRVAHDSVRVVHLGRNAQPRHSRTDADGRGRRTHTVAFECEGAFLG